MANITNTEAVKYVPEIWAQKGLEVLRNNVVLAPLVTKDSELEVFNRGQTLHVPYPGTLSANAKAANTVVTRQNPQSTGIDVTLNKHKEVTFLVEDYTRAMAQPTYMSELMDAAIVPLAEQVESDLFALYSAFSGTAGTAGTDLNAATLRAVNKKFTDNKIPRGNRNLVISTKDTASLLADSSLQNFFAYNEGARNDISTGLIADNLYGLKIYESQLVPVVAGTPNSTKNLAFDRGGLVLASRQLPDAPAGTGVYQTSVKDPLSGLILRVTLSYDPNMLGVQCTTDILYGVALLRDAKAFPVLS
jgi:hypothetical protein